MAADVRTIIDGRPGEVWVNNTSRVRYQFFASLHNTCGVCLQYHGKIGPPWPIPIHHGCRCRQVAIPPQAQAPEPFVDYQKLLDGMPPDQQAAAIGKSNYKLLKAGVVSWSDVVTPARVRDLREVVALKKLSVVRMVKSGVRPKDAELAHESVNTPAHVLAGTKRRELIERIAKAGLSQEALAKELASRLAARVTIAPGASYTTKAGVVLPGIRGGTLPGVGPSHAAALEKALAAISITRVAMGAKPKTLSKPIGQPSEPDRPIEERIAGLPQDRLAAVQRIGIEIDEARMVLDRARKETEDYLTDVRAGKVDDRKVMAGLDKREAAEKQASARLSDLLDRRRERVRAILEVPAADRQPWQHSDGAGFWEGGPAIKAVEARRGQARDWLESLVAGGPGASPVQVKWTVEPGKRAVAYKTAREIGIPLESAVDTHVHEMGHQVEYQIPGVATAAQQFLAYRAGNQPPVRMDHLFPNSGFGPDEFGRDDDFGRAFGRGTKEAWYTGQPANHGHSEVVSMGVELLYRDPVTFARSDPEYFQFIAGILRGDLR